VASFQDLFNRADSSDLGAGYTACLGLRNAIVSNKCAGGSSGNSTGDFYTGASFGNDQYAEAVIGGKAALSYFSVLGRGSGSAATRNVYQCTLGGANEYYISKLLLGVTQAGEVSGTTAFADGDVLRLEVSGTTTVTVTLKKNGVTVNTLTDSSSPIASGSTGLEFFWGTPATRPTFDNFDTGDISSGPSIAVLAQSHYRRRRKP
jgi:hypothetical protein